MTLSDWTFSQTISPPKVLTIKYQTQGGANQSVDLISTDIGETRTTYVTLNYFDELGKPQTADVATLKVETLRTTQAAVNGSLVAGRLSFGLGLPPGDALRITTTEYFYRITPTGPLLIKERTETEITTSELAGGLAVPNESYEFYEPGVDLFVAMVTEIEYETVITESGRELTKQSTKRWQSYGISQIGQQAFKAQMEQTQDRAIDPIEGPDWVGSSIESMKMLIFDGNDIQINVGRAPVPEKPSDEELLRDEALNPADPDGFTDGGDGGGDGNSFVEGAVQFDGSQPFNPDDNTNKVVYDMPFAPDDVWEYINGVRTLVPGNAAAAAEAFGRTEIALDVGHAFGHNIVTGWNEFPTLDLNPVYLRLAGIEAAFLSDGTAYAWDGSGMVVSSDLMLLGATGFYGASAPATSWLRLPVPAGGLLSAGTPATATAAKANSIAIPNGFDVRSPSAVFAALPTNGADVFSAARNGINLVAPTLEVELLRVSAGPSLRTLELPYALVLPAESFELATGPVAEVFAGGVVPAAVITATAAAPVVSTGASVLVPAAGVSVAGAAPAVAGGSSVAVPAAGVVVTALLPELVGRLKTVVSVPAASVVVAGAAPGVVSGASVAVPAAAVTVSGAVPSSIGPIKIPVNGITYSQSSLWSGATAANNSIMTDKSFTNTGTATNLNNPAWIRMDLGASYDVAKVIIGTATSSIPGGWNKSYTENRNLQYSTDGTSWTTALNTGSFASNGIYTFDVSFNARYIRLATSGSEYVALSEFYALTAGQTY